MQTIFDSISECIKEYGRKINGGKSTVVCINGVKKERKWNISGCAMGEVDKYNYLGVTVKAGLNVVLRICGTSLWRQIMYLEW